MVRALLLCVFAIGCGSKPQVTIPEQTKYETVSEKQPALTPDLVAAAVAFSDLGTWAKLRIQKKVLIAEEIAARLHGDESDKDREEFTDAYVTVLNDATKSTAFSSKMLIRDVVISFEVLNRALNEQSGDNDAAITEAMRRKLIGK